MEFDDLFDVDRFEITNGQVLVLRGESERESVRRIGSTERCQLVVNRALGFSGNDLEFLRDVGAKIVSLEVVGDFKDDSGIAYCRNLEELNLNTSCQNPIDWAKLDKLRYLFTYAHRIRQAIGVLGRLTNLHLDSASETELSAMQDAQHLRKLTLTSPRVAVLDLTAELHDLRVLQLSRAGKISGFDPLGEISSLQSLSINECKGLTNIGFVAKLSQLRLLDIGDNKRIDSLAPLSGCLELEELLFYGSTNIGDGDLGVLSHLPNLTTAAYQVRRHYKNAPGGFPSMD